MKKVKTIEEAHKVFDLLGVKNVTKRWQHKKGTHVFELPLKTMYYNGHGAINRFTVYKNGYVRKMIVNDETNASYGCYQLNLVRKIPKFVKDYEWCDERNDSFWTGKYNKVYNRERVMIDRHDNRVVYLCNYILKNYYRSNKYNLVENYTMWRVAETHGEWWRSKRNQDDLPFFDGDEHDLALEEFKKIPKESFTDVDDIKVIINDKCYKLI